MLTVGVDAFIKLILGAHGIQDLSDCLAFQMSDPARHHDASVIGA